MNLFDKKEHEEEQFDDLDLTDGDLSGHLFENCTFVGCSFKNANLSKTRWIGCRFVRSDLSNSNLSHARMRDIQFESCKLIGIQWVQVDDLVGLSFQECKLNYGNFLGLKLKKTCFLKSALRDVDFSDADLTESDFRDSDLFNARFNRTSLLKSDFRGAQNYLIDPIGNKIKGARFSMPEAQGLLAGLGIRLD